jgi:hypothetical protein
MALITDMAQKELLAKAVFSNYFNNVSQFAVKGMKSISFPKLSAFTVTERASGGVVDAQAITSTVDTLNLNVPATLKWIIDPNDSIQSTLNWELELISKAAASHGRYFDAKIRAVVLASATEVAAVGNISRDKVLEMRQYLKKNEADMSLVALFISPAQETELLKISEFSANQVYGSPVIQTGSLGKVFGIDVVVCNTLEDGEYFMAEKNAIAYGFQREPAYGEQDDLDYGVGAKKRGLDSLYGVCALEIGQGTAAPTKSGLMIKFKAA